jgi:hypothetical protein
MITKELIDTQLGAILAALGKPVCNAALWTQELGANAPTEAEILAKKAELDAQAEAAKQKSALVLAYEAAIEQGFTIPGTNIVMSVAPSSRAVLNDYASHLARKFDVDEITLQTPVQVVDKDDAVHVIEYEDFLAMLLPLGDRCLEVYFLGKQAGAI